MTQLLVLLVGAVAGFVGSRQLRRLTRRSPARALGPAPAQPAGPAPAGPSPARGPAAPSALGSHAASVARSVGAGLGRRKGLSAPELQRACFSEMVRHVRVTRHGRTHAPARYLLRLHPDDMATVDEARNWFTEGLTDALERAATDNGWVLGGAIQIDYQADPGRPAGAPSALAVSPDDPAGSAPGAPPPAAGRRLAVVRGDTGESVTLSGPVTIGRSRDRDLTVDDTRVSRSHARIESRAGGTWVVVDEGSANGTRLRGEEIPPHEPRPIRPGDVIGIGPVDLRVTTAADRGAGQPGTRALEDSDRTRISGEVLPRDQRGEGDGAGR